MKKEFWIALAKSVTWIVVGMTAISVAITGVFMLCEKIQDWWQNRKKNRYIKIVPRQSEEIDD